MAPEQFTGGPVDQRCDVWATGCLLCECLTGKRAIASFGEDGRPDLSRLPRRLPKNVRALLEECLQRDPDRRRITAREVADTLARATDHLRGRRRRWLIGGAAAVAAASLGLAGLAAIRFNGPRPPLEKVEVVGTNSVRAVDAAGQTLWAHRMPTAMVSTPWGRMQPRVVRRDGRPDGILVATGSGSLPPAAWCLAPDDGHVRWRWTAAWKPPVNAQAGLEIRWLTSLPWPGERAPAIAVGIRDGMWYSSAIQFLDSAGKPLGTYYHPGPLEPAGSFQAPSDSTTLCVFTGNNSSARFTRSLIPYETREHPVCVLVLAPPNVDGQAFPWTEGLPEKRDWPGMSRAKEVGYLLIPLLRPSIPATVSGSSVRTSDDGQPVITLMMRDGRFYYLDALLRPQTCYLKIRSPADSLYARGERQFPPVMLIRDGKITMHEPPLTF